jgi:hypothetical protein
MAIPYQRVAGFPVAGRGSLGCGVAGLLGYWVTGLLGCEVGRHVEDGHLSVNVCACGHLKTDGIARPPWGRAGLSLPPLGAALATFRTER